jgi:hypothetical protein
MPNPDGGLTPAQLASYFAKQDRERPECEQLTRRYRSACFWLESNFNSLIHWRRFVEHTEHIIVQFRREEHALPPFEGSAFMRELCAEDPRLWAAYIAMAPPTTEAQP